MLGSRRLAANDLEPPVRLVGQVDVVPNEEVARMDVTIHVRRWFRRKCRSCREPWVCPARLNALRVLGWQADRTLSDLYVVGVLVGVLVVAFVAGVIAR